MQISLESIVEAVMLVVALSTDAFISCFAYGSNKIKIPFTSIQVINLVCTSILAISLFFGTLIKEFIPREFTSIICFFILFMLGVIKLMDSTIKSIIRKHNNLKKEIKFSMFSINFILNLYVNPEEADVDCSRILSAAEAASLAIALSLDSLGVGIGAGLGTINIPLIIILSFVSGTVAVILGCYSGNKVAEATPMNLSWLSGIFLIVLALFK